MAAVLWLHGVGDTGDGWMGQFRSVEREVPGLKMVHPTAPEQMLSCFGELSTSWFDIAKWRPPVKPIGLDEPDPPDQLDATIKFMHEEFDKLVESGIPANKILVGGFSQGGAASLVAGLTYPKKIGGIVSISGWSCYRESKDTLISKIPEENKSTPSLFCCGDRDDVIDLPLSRTSKEIFTEICGDSFTYMESRRSGHFQNRQEMEAIYSFMINCLK